MIGKNKMKDWKAAIRTWEKPNNEPNWLNKNIDQEIASEEEQKRIEKIIKRKNKTIKEYKRCLANYKSSFTLYN